ncbi:MAG: sigma-70 family RNA polymerase sigma factor [Chloroflexia bacterium]|nr:sigma-70 family RNA polymerase sigma factor [Chloroflexia bacterium]
MLRRRLRLRWDRDPTPETTAASPPVGGVPGPDDDHAMMAAARTGDLAAFNALVERHQRVVFAVCYRLLGDTASAEDAAQDTFVRAWQSAGGWQGGLVRPWLLRIATNRCYDVLRSRARRPTGSLDAAPVEVEPRWSSQVETEDAEGHAARAELSARLERALATLPFDQRAAIVLVDIQGVSYEEASQIMGAAIGTVKSRISRGRARLRDDLRGDGAAWEHFTRHTRLPATDETGRAASGPGDEGV